MEIVLFRIKQTRVPLLRRSPIVAKVGYCVPIALYSLSSVLPAQTLTITNPLNQSRPQEVIELPLSEVTKHVGTFDHKSAENALTHELLPTQLYTDPNHPSSKFLLIAVQLPAAGKLTIDFIPATTPPAPLVFGREAPERKDDFAWENKFTAYRVYGPALEATGEITSGIDVWSKRVPNFVIDSFYKHDAEGQRTHNPALSYHKDDGVGLDSYLVGPTRGCGGTAVLSAGKLWVSKNYTHLKQLAAGPIRFQFELTYAPWSANGSQVTETKRITLDAGTHLNKIESTFIFTGPKSIDAVAGLATHANPEVTQLAAGKIQSVWDTPQDDSAGKIATGLIATNSQKSTATQLDNQALLVFPVTSGQTFTYYAGSGWSKADMPTPQSWNTYLEQSLQQLEHPLTIQWTGTKNLQ